MNGARKIRLLLPILLALALLLPSVALATPSSGQILWVARARRGKADSAQAVAVSADGSKVYVTGDHDAALGQADWATLAYDETSGRILWTARRGSGRFDHTQSIAAAPDGTLVFVAGSVDLSPGDTEWATAAYDADTGAERWFVERNDSAFGDFPRKVLVSPDSSTVYVIGDVDGGASDYVTVAYGATTGAELWIQRYDGPSHNDDFVFDAALSRDGSSLVVAGASYQDGEYYDFATVAYDTHMGSQAWVTRYAGVGHGFDYAQALGFSPDGSKVFVSGSASEQTGDRFSTFALDASTGDPSWQSESADGGWDVIGLAVSPDGSQIFVTGTIQDPPTAPYDVETISYEAATGMQLWVRRYDGPSHGRDDAIDVAADPDGSRVFVTADSYGPGGVTNYATMAIGARKGNRLWLRWYDGPGHGGRDEPVDLAVSPDGTTVFVFGTSVGKRGDFDMATVAYGA